MEQENKNILNKVASKLEIAEDGKFSMNDVISLILKSPDCRVNRAEFLNSIFADKYNQDIIDKAIETSPGDAGIDSEELKSLTKEIIEKAKTDLKASEALKGAISKEKNIDKVKGIITSLSENRNIKELVKTSQKVLYLFSFPEVKISDSGSISQAKARLVMLLSLASMMGTEGADEAIKAVAYVIPELPEDIQIMEKLDKEEIGQILKKWRQKFIATYAAMQAANSNPLVGAITKKGASELTFDKNCNKLIDVLADTKLSNPNHIVSEKEQEFIDLIRKAIE